MIWSVRLDVDDSRGGELGTGMEPRLELEGADVVVVVGPTASGKSELALRLAQARNGEIIGADSVHVYRHFDIGSSKPSPADRKSVPHHLIDIADPLEPLDAAAYAAHADHAISETKQRGKLPIVCGGTFLWVRALLYGLSRAPSGDPEIRARHAEVVKLEGRPALHARLSRVDPEAARRLGPNDFVRVSRALEVFEITGRPLSAAQHEHGFRVPRYRSKLFGIGWSHDELLARIAERTERVLRAGFVDEVEQLVRLGYRDARAMSSVGYRQVLDVVEGRLTREELGPAINRATKVFARKQRTWLRTQPVTWLAPRRQ